MIDVNLPALPSDVVIKAINSVYLDAEVSDGEPYLEPSVERPFWRLVEFFGQVLQFPRPILYAHEIGKSDPLTCTSSKEMGHEKGLAKRYYSPV